MTDCNEGACEAARTVVARAANARRRVPHSDPFHDPRVVAFVGAPADYSSGCYGAFLRKCNVRTFLTVSKEACLQFYMRV